MPFNTKYRCLLFKSLSVILYGLDAHLFNLLKYSPQFKKKKKKKKQEGTQSGMNSILLFEF